MTQTYNPFRTQRADFSVDRISTLASKFAGMVSAEKEPLDAFSAMMISLLYFYNLNSDKMSWDEFRETISDSLDIAHASAKDLK